MHMATETSETGEGVIVFPTEDSNGTVESTTINNPTPTTDVTVVGGQGTPANTDLLPWIMGLTVLVVIVILFATRKSGEHPNDGYDKH